MSATAMSGESSSSSATAAEEETAACCDCCGLVEECTPAYEARVRERYGGRWICGLCGEAVEEELLRSAPISADEALARHATFCRAFRSAAPPAPLDNADHLIAALRHLLRRSLDSPPRPLHPLQPRPPHPHQQPRRRLLLLRRGAGALRELLHDPRRLLPRLLHNHGSQSIPNTPLPNRTKPNLNFTTRPDHFPRIPSPSPSSAPRPPLRCPRPRSRSRSERPAWELLLLLLLLLLPIARSIGGAREPPRPLPGAAPCSTKCRAERGALRGLVIARALGSCLDRDTLSLPVAGGGEFGVKGVAFDLDRRWGDSAPASEPDVAKLLSGAQSRHKIFYEEFVLRAFFEAERAHRGQRRLSGDHICNIVLRRRCCLHRLRFGAGVADLVEGVSRLSHLSKLARESNTASRIVEAYRLHTMFLAMEDARSVLIKLADRLHNMMTLEPLPVIKQQRFAKETLEIFAPLANRLGILTWKEQLENLCFKYLYPEQYKELSSWFLNSYNKDIITVAIRKLDQALKISGVSYYVITGRHKSLYSIYTKMLRRNLSIDEIHDIDGIRLILENEKDCFMALSIVHNLWLGVPEKFKDYINHPKPNGYQSLHTVVLTEDMHPLEVQIRTREMHIKAEFGIAAHWKYKEGDCECSAFVPHLVEWVRGVVTCQCETININCVICGGVSVRSPYSFPLHSDDCPYAYTKQCNHTGPIFVILLENEKMSVQEFPPNSTLIDLLERIGGDSTKRLVHAIAVKGELRPRLNCESVKDPYQKLSMGDVVELVPVIPRPPLTDYREEFQRMYDCGLIVSSRDGRRC
uniref:RelA/SpoT domain-containing protein n=1 Tax=Ananas comosus var. bracteatus TaxID=296719 RepID=A0A6V7PN19_ANACO|nr:unnamed protein product [Ananas comosus var. bracteatus]